MQITMAVAHQADGQEVAPSRGSGESRCFANHNGSSAPDRRGAQRRTRPQGGPAATPRAATPSRVSGENRCDANHTGSSAHDRRGAQRRLRAPQPLLEALARTVAMQITMAVAHTTAGGPSGDSARRSPFYRLWREPLLCNSQWQ